MNYDSDAVLHCIVAQAFEKKPVIFRHSKKKIEFIDQS